jgi:hypothetical protein
MADKRLAEKVVNGYVEEALQTLLDTYGEDAHKLYNQWCNVRNCIYRDESNRSPTYFDEMGDLMDMITNPEDRARMLTITYGTLQLQHRLHNQKKPYLKDREANAVFKKIRPIVADFYDFVLPEGTWQAYKEEETRRRVEKQQSGHGKISSQRAEAMLEVALQRTRERMVTLADTWEVIASLLLLCGRRQYEMLVTMTVGPGDSEYQCRVSNLTKRHDHNTDSILIPLLCPYTLFKETLEEVRSEPSFDWFTTMPQIECTHRISSLLRAANSRLFGHGFTHTIRRTVYVNLAWRRRFSENHFMVQASKGLFVQHALGHSNVAISDSQVYQAFSLDDETDHYVN